MPNRISALATALLLLTCACSSSRPPAPPPTLLGDRCSPDHFEHARVVVFDEAAAKQLTEEARTRLAKGDLNAPRGVQGRKAKLTAELHVTQQGEVACVRYVGGDDRIFPAVASHLHKELRFTPPGNERAAEGLLLPLDLTVSWTSGGVGSVVNSPREPHASSGGFGAAIGGLSPEISVKFAGPAAARIRD